MKQMQNRETTTPVIMIIETRDCEAVWMCNVGNLKTGNCILAYVFIRMLTYALVTIITMCVIRVLTYAIVTILGRVI